MLSLDTALNKAKGILGSTGDERPPNRMGTEQDKDPLLLQYCDPDEAFIFIF